MGNKLEIQEMCGITFTDPENSDIIFTDGNPAVGSITVPTDFGPVEIPVCEKCVQAISEQYQLSIGE